MPIPTDAEIDSAVPPNGIPVRSLTNDVLKRTAASAQAGEFAASFVQRNTPIDGAFLATLQNKKDGIVVIEGSGDISLLHFQLPTADGQRLGQIIRIVSRIGVAALDFTGVSVVHNPPTELFTGDAYALQNIGTDEWIRIVG